MDHDKIKEEALSFLKNHKTAVLSTATTDGKPQSSVIYYVAEDDFSIYFITDPASTKAKNIAQNKNVALVIGFGPEISTLQGTGVIDEGEGKYKTLDIISMIGAKLNQNEMRYWPIVKLDMEGWRAFKIKLENLTWLNMDIANAPANVYKEGFHQILP